MPTAARQSVTLATLARELGVSKATISNAYNHPDRLSAALRRRILDTAERLGYPGPNPAAATLSRGRVGAIGVVFFDDAAYALSFAFTDPAHALFLQGIADTCGRAGVGLVLVGGQRADLVRTALVDGFICQCDVPDDERIAAGLARGVPVVIVDGQPPAGMPSVRVDDRLGASLSARHLLGLGHHRLAVLSAPLAPTGATPADLDPHRQDDVRYGVVRDRLRGYRSAVEAVGLAWSSVPIAAASPYGQNAARRATNLLLDAADRPTGLLAMTDELALGALSAATDRGIPVPEELSIVGFDDIPAAARARPALTTVHQPHYRKGARAAQYLLERPATTATVLPVDLVLRESTQGPPRP
jgi:DNA-binding LacI/PurR family transcriptional regulator